MWWAYCAQGAYMSAVHGKWCLSCHAKQISLVLCFNVAIFEIVANRHVPIIIFSYNDVTFVFFFAVSSKVFILLSSIVFCCVFT